MKITIIIPVYNVEPYIEDCLKSVAAQTYKGNIECIIVNDCTPDGSCAIIERFIKEYNGNIDFKLLHHTKNRGLSAARNTGIDAATGEYIYFLDSDDEITADCIELLTEPLKQKKYDFVIGDYVIIGNKKGIPPLTLEHRAELEGVEIRNSYFSLQWYVMAWNKLCNIEFIRKEKLFFEERLIHEDEIWSFQLACTAQSMYAMKECTYMYKVRETSIMGRQNAANKAYAFSKITAEAYKWSLAKGIAYNKNVFNKIIWFREYALHSIASLDNGKERKKAYLKCYKELRIGPWQAYENRAIKTPSLIKEIYNYMPGTLGYWYLRMYNFLLKR